MAEMTNEVIDGVISAIAEEFPSIPIYDEQVEQGLAEPSFFVRSIRPRQSLFMGKRYKRRELIEVTYFPPESYIPPEPGRKRSVNGVLETLFSILEIITAGKDRIRGSNMEGHVDENDVGVFTVAYDYFVLTDDGTAEPPITEFKLKGVNVK